MALTPAQLATLKAAITADGTAGPLRAAGDTASLLAWCNAPSATAAWRTRVFGSEIYDAHNVNDYIARTQGERDAFDLLANMSRVHDFTVASKRNGVKNIYSGAANQGSRESILLVCQEFATNAQMVLGGAQQVVTGGKADGSDMTALKRTYADLITIDEVNKLVT